MAATKSIDIEWCQDTCSVLGWTRDHSWSVTRHVLGGVAKRVCVFRVVCAARMVSCALRLLLCRCGGIAWRTQIYACSEYNDRHLHVRDWICIEHRVSRYETCKHSKAHVALILGQIPYNSVDFCRPHSLRYAMLSY